MLINPPTTPPPDITGRLAFLIAALLRACGPHITKDRNAGPWLIRVWNRMNAISQRIQRLAEQIRTGTVPPLRAGYKLTKPRKPPTRPPIVLPNHPMWLIQVIQPTAVYGVWLQQILADPEMPAMLAAAPQLARILRPLCRALGVTPPPLPPRPPRRLTPDTSPAFDCDADPQRTERWAAGPGPATHPSPEPDPPRGPSPQAGTASAPPDPRQEPPLGGRPRAALRRPAPPRTGPPSAGHAREKPA